MVFLTLHQLWELKKDEPCVIFLMKNSFGDYSVVNNNLGKIKLTGGEPEAFCKL